MNEDLREMERSDATVGFRGADVRGERFMIDDTVYDTVGVADDQSPDGFYATPVQVRVLGDRDDWYDQWRFVDEDGHRWLHFQVNFVDYERGEIADVDFVYTPKESAP